MGAHGRTSGIATLAMALLLAHRPGTTCCLRERAHKRQGKARQKAGASVDGKIVASRAQVEKLKVASYQHSSLVMMVHLLAVPRTSERAGRLR